MDFLAQLTESLGSRKDNKQLIDFANRTWQQLEQHAAEGPESYKNFQKATLSAALNTAPSDPQLSQRQPSLMIETCIEASTSSLLIDTAPVTIHVFRLAPSFAASMSGRKSRQQPYQGKASGPVNLQVCWQSHKLAQSTREPVTIYVDCPAKAVDVVTEGHISSFARAHLLEQVLAFVEDKEGVKLGRRSAKLTIQGSIKASMTSIGKIDDPVQSHSSAPHLPASLISKLSLLPLETASDSTKPQPSPSLSNVADAPARRKKPLILELDTN